MSERHLLDESLITDDMIEGNGIIDKKQVAHSLKRWYNNQEIQIGQDLR